MSNDWENDYEIPAEIDLKKGKWIRNPYTQSFRELNLVSLDEDVKKAYPDSEAVNTALRALIEARKLKQDVELAKAS